MSYKNLDCLLVAIGILLNGRWMPAKLQALMYAWISRSMLTPSTPAIYLVYAATNLKLMFPFKTRQFSFQTDLTIEQLQHRLETSVSKQKLISINRDGQLYGRINGNMAVIEIGQSFERNSFRPVVVFKWTNSNSKAEISGYYRVAFSVIFGTLLFPLFGLYLTIQINNILPVIFCALIWIFIYATFGRWLFNKDFKWTEEKLLDLVKR